VILGGYLMGFFNFILAPNANNWLNGLARVTSQPALAKFSLDDKKMLIFGLLLVLMMLLRPEGLLPSARRKAELHPEAEDIVVAEQETLYEVSETAGGK
jgi:branched-chain amino acid transport system permease protein